MTTEEFVAQHRLADVNALALKMRQYPEVDAAFALQQIEGYQKAQYKLPEIAAIDGWQWPKRLSMEQCSSQTTALYKRAVLEKWKNEKRTIGGRLIDLTGGLGVDTFYLSDLFEEVHYVERQEELCRLAEHNFALTGKHIHVHNCSAEKFLGANTPSPRTPPNLGGEYNGTNKTNGTNKHQETNELLKSETVVFIDPARRDSHGGKVFRLQDCEPDVTALLPQIYARAGMIVLKLSPMLDITEAVRAWGGAAEVHVVAVRNEVKEVLVVLKNGGNSLDPEIVCVNLETEEEPFVFRRSEDRRVAEDILLTDRAREAIEAQEIVLLEPNAAIQKAGAFKLFAARYRLKKLGVNTHLYSTDTLSKAESSTDLGIPARVFVARVATKEELAKVKQANVICRNYPLTPEAVRKKYGLKDGGETYLIATRVGEKPTLFLASRQFLHTFK
ncbi:MAG: hypothetical protein IKN59_04450 [Paludibacteraceae bacterium]|nr:hypothetical protein [Paludibacteraceae bacterium]